MIIDQLPLLGGDVQGTDEFPIERGTTTYKTTQAALIKPATDAAAAAQAAADDAQLAADNAQDTADEANEKGLPPGGTAGQVLTKADSSDYSASWEDPSGGGDVTADMLGIVIDGNSTPVGASIGQYVIVKNSTISGITDGLYTAAQAIPANTAINATYLTAIPNGGLNAFVKEQISLTFNITTGQGVQSYSCYKVAGLIWLALELVTIPAPAQAGDPLEVFEMTIAGLPAYPETILCNVAIYGGFTFEAVLRPLSHPTRPGHLTVASRSTAASPIARVVFTFPA